MFNYRSVASEYHFKLFFFISSFITFPLKSILLFASLKLLELSRHFMFMIDVKYTRVNLTVPSMEALAMLSPDAEKRHRVIGLV